MILKADNLKYFGIIVDLDIFGICYFSLSSDPFAMRTPSLCQSSPNVLWKSLIYSVSRVKSMLKRVKMSEATGTE